MLKHIVMWRLQSQPHAAQLKALLEALPMTIAEIESFEVGVNFAEGDAVCDVVLVSAFADLEALARYPRPSGSPEGGTVSGRRIQGTLRRRLHDLMPAC